MADSFKQEICGRGHCAKCLGMDSESLAWRSDECRFLGLPRDWPVVCGKTRAVIDSPYLAKANPATFASLASVASMMSDADRETYSKITEEQKACGCRNKFPRLQSQLVAKYGHLVSTRPRTLIIGNSPEPTIAPHGGWDNIIVFNNIAHREWMPIATEHWMRSDNEAMTHHGGEHLIPSHSAIPVFVDAGAHGVEMAKSLSGRGSRLFSCRSVISKVANPATPSTGYACIVHFVRMGHSVTIDGFSWNGNKVHDWNLERRECHAMARDGRLHIMGEGGV